MGIGMGFAVAAPPLRTGKPVLAVEGDSAFGFSGMEIENDLPVQPAGLCLLSLTTMASIAAPEHQ